MEYFILMQMSVLEIFERVMNYFSLSDYLLFEIFMMHGASDWVTGAQNVFYLGFHVRKICPKAYTNMG